MNKSFYDVLHVSDFRFPGTVVQSAVKEIRAESDAGLRTAVAQASSARDRKARGWHPKIQSALAWSNVAAVSSRASLRVRLVIVDHPQVLLECPETFENVETQKVVLVAREANVDESGECRLARQASSIARKAHALFGVEPEWVVSGPAVDDDLRELGFDARVVEPYWWDIVRIYGVDSPRTGPAGAVPVVGMHGHGGYGTLPVAETDLLAVYPSAPDVQICMRTEPLVPANRRAATAHWTFSSPGEESVSDFLRRLDFWVYFPASGVGATDFREIHEALAAGLVVVLPLDSRENFGDAAVYAEPHDVSRVIRIYHADTHLYSDQSRKAQSFIRSLGPEGHIKRLIDKGVEASKHAAPKGTESVRSVHRRVQRALFVTSNGAGMGHLTRLLAVANRLPESTQSVFASLSLGVHIVDQYGYPYEYIASREAASIPNKEWNDYASERFDILLEEVRPDTLVFDGVWPYRGLRSALKGTGIQAIWMRRGMWRAESSARPLAWASEFDQVIQPGEFAEEYDNGPTSKTQNSGVAEVPPITLLSQPDLLSREEARKELGYGQDDRIVLITLGAGNINDIGNLQHAVLKWFKDEAPEWRVVVTKPPIALGESLHGVDTLQVYPLAKYTRAFDLSVSAAGYNAFHEWMLGELPTLWVPNLFTRTDDQLARARWASDRAFGSYLPDDTNSQLLGEALHRMTELNVLSSMRQKLSTLDKANGADQAAALIVGE